MTSVSKDQSTGLLAPIWLHHYDDDGDDAEFVKRRGVSDRQSKN